MKDTTQIILKPVITERSNAMKETENRFVFEVHPKANKREIKLAVESSSTSPCRTCEPAS
jgi:large subunit ribosomal protein L23